MVTSSQSVSSRKSSVQSSRLLVSHSSPSWWINSLMLLSLLKVTMVDRMRTVYRCGSIWSGRLRINLSRVVGWTLSLLWRLRLRTISDIIGRMIEERSCWKRRSILTQFLSRFKATLCANSSLTTLSIMAPLRVSSSQAKSLTQTLSMLFHLDSCHADSKTAKKIDTSLRRKEMWLRSTSLWMESGPLATILLETMSILLRFQK